MKTQISKVKSQNYNLKVKSFTLYAAVLSFALCVLSLAPVALGQSPTPEATPTIVEDENIKSIREKVKAKVQEKLEETSKGQKRAFVGNILDITEGTLVLDTKKEEKQVMITEETEIIGLGRKSIEVEDLEIDGFVIVMGYIQDSGLLEAHRIVITKKPETPARLVAFGEVTDKSSDEKILSVKHPKKGTIWSVEVTSKTKKITKKIEGEMEEVKFDDIEIGDRMVAIGSPDEEENFLTAKIIHVIPASPSGGPGEAVEQEESPSPSPEPTPTPEEEEE